MSISDSLIQLHTKYRADVAQLIVGAGVQLDRVQLDREEKGESTILEILCKVGDLIAVEEAIRHGISPTLECLENAAKHGHIGIVKLLCDIHDFSEPEKYRGAIAACLGDGLRQHFDIAIYLGFSRDILFTDACANGDFAVVRATVTFPRGKLMGVSRGKLMSVSDREGLCSPVGVSDREGSYPRLPRISGSPPDPRLPRISGSPPEVSYCTGIKNAIRERQDRILDFLITAPDGSGGTLPRFVLTKMFDFACGENYIAGMVYLQDKGAAIGEAALISAAANGAFSATSWLLEQKAPVSDAALIASVAGDHFEVAAILLEAGSSGKTYGCLEFETPTWTREPSTALIHAILNENEEMIDLLLAYGATPDPRGKILTFAVRTKQLNIVNKFLQPTHNVSRSALRWSIRNETFDITQQLLLSLSQYYLNCASEAIKLSQFKLD